MSPLQDPERLRGALLFASLTDEEWEAIARHIRERTYYEDEAIVSEGETVHSLIIINAGCLKVIRRFEKEEVVLAYLSEGQHAGEMSLLGGGYRAGADVVAEVETEVWEISQSHLLEEMERCEALAAKLYKVFCEILVERLRRLNDAYVTRK